MDTKYRDIIDVLGRIVADYPDNVAILEDGVGVMTYNQMWQKAQSLATYILENSEASQYVGIKIGKSAAYVTSGMACGRKGIRSYWIRPSRSTPTIHYS